MRILVIYPINHDTFIEPATREIDSLNIQDLSFDITHLSKGPNYIENRYQNYQAQEDVIRLAIKAQTDGYDGVFIDVFTDTAVDVIRELIEIPVVGAFEPALLTANLVAQKYSIITAVSGVTPIYEDLSRKLACRDSLVSIRHVDTNICNMLNKEALLQHLIIESEQAIAEGAQAIILGCTGMVGVKEKLECHLSIPTQFIPVISPAQSAILMLYSLVKQKITQSGIAYPIVARNLLKSTS